MTTQATPAAARSGSDRADELFVLTDEQILDIAPEVPHHDSGSVQGVMLSEAKHPSSIDEAARSKGDSSPAAQAMARSSSVADLPQNNNAPTTDHGSRNTGHDASAEPPQWLAAQMNDPWSGEDAKEFWHGVQQTKSEAQAYRASIATPEDARALKELYPGGISEAQAAADRARMLDQIDRAYFGGEGNSPEQRSASRAQLAQQLLREDPTAFREMLAAGLEALQQVTEPENQRGKSLGTAAAPKSDATTTSVVVAQHAAPDLGMISSSNAVVSSHQSPTTSHQSLSAYAAFERAANDDLERSVGATIDRALTQAIPVAQALMPEQRKVQATTDPAQARASALRERLATSIRAEVEKSLQGDRQLADQVAQVLAARRFDPDTRAQVVRLINDRAQQLIPTAAKRILNDWTQTTLAAHRSRTQRTDTTATAIDVALASSPVHSESAARNSRPVMLSEAKHPSSLPSRRVDYRKLTDEQILNLQ